MRVKLGVTTGRTKEIGQALVLALIRARFRVDLHPADWIANVHQIVELVIRLRRMD